MRVQRTRYYAPVSIVLTLMSLSMHEPNTAIDPYPSFCLALLEKIITKRLERLQTPVEGTRIDSVHGRFDLAQIFGQLLTLLHPFGCQRRISGYSGRGRHGRGVDTRLGVYRPVGAKLDTPEDTLEEMP